MTINKKQAASERVNLKGILAEFRTALEEEIEKIENSGQSSTLLFAGRRIENSGSDFWYRFNVEFVPVLPADTPCKLVIGKDQFDVTVISFDENSIVISSKRPLPDSIGKARLENGATVLMERLIKCIEKNADKENTAGNRMLAPGGGIYPFKEITSYDDLDLEDSNTSSQNKAIIAALTNDITYIWGPPGTGKTTVIGQIIDGLYKHDRSVLVVSHTNSAVDGAIEKAHKTYSKSIAKTDEHYPILRLGIPTRELPKSVSLDAHIAELGNDLYKRKEEFERQQAMYQHRLSIIRPILSKVRWMKESELDEIGTKIADIAVCKKEIEAIKSNIESLKDAVRREEEIHPEYAAYLELEQTFVAKKLEHDNFCKYENKIQTELIKRQKQKQNALDELKKHDVYTELLKKESSFISEEELKNKISQCSTIITSSERIINNLLMNQEKAQQIVSDYEKKNAVARFFAGKSTVAQAKSDFESIGMQLLRAQDELQQCKVSQNAYEQQLEELYYLQQQIKENIPLETPEYWKRETERIEVEIAASEKGLTDLISQKDNLYFKLCDLEQKRNDTKVIFDALNKLKKEVEEEQNRLALLNATLSQENMICSEHLERECLLCVAFFDKGGAKENEDLFQELSALFVSVQQELSRVNVELLVSEKESIDNQLKQIEAKIHELNQKMQELEKQAILSAKIVGTTLAKTYLNETLRERKFDTVILDEASMASIPALWCASYLAEKSIVIVGDFLQLPPIVMASTPTAQKWLGKDIFYHSGMQEQAKNKTTCPGNFVMLNDQFRMESDIADIANMYYGAYGGLLSHDMNDRRVKARDGFYKWYSGNRTKRNIHLIDTESLHAWVTGVPQGKSHSRLNCFSAAVTVDLAFKLLENKLKDIDPANAEIEKEASVLIIAPYKPHIAKINQLIDLEYKNRGFNENLRHIRAGTIHSFQGSEADIVIFDLVIDEPHWKANLFMTDKEINEDLQKMFNVAITRAKFKLYIVGNFAYCQKRARNNALAELLDKLFRVEGIAKVDAKKLLPNITFARQNVSSVSGSFSEEHIVCREESFNDYFMEDVLSFRKRHIIYSPFMTENRLSVLLPAFADAINSGKQIVVVTKALSDRSKTEIPQYKKCEQILRDTGISVFHKKGMHEKLIFVDSEAVWIGSLNALSFTGNTGEVMQRHSDEKLTAEYEKLFNIEHICGAIEKPYEQKCPICAEEMIVRESAEGGIYWECVGGDYSRNVKQQYPLDGILRCECGATFKFSMKNEPRWVCSQGCGKYRKMRESDLKLEKMAALIQTKAERKEVDRYFKEKRQEREAAKKKA